ncbi:MAG: glycosyltransferase family 4 protein, partial [Desulfobacteraceae bacterium]|nr:glycosyltransferase family 4 protein [Desulfobacteraceae bacterium]
EFVGALRPSEVPDFLGSVDVYLFPSQFEGCPNALLEAIMAGCLPVSWRLEGITDFIIKDGDTGFVCPMADCEVFATHIAELSEHRDLLQQMSEAAVCDARKRFSQTRVAADYACLINDVMQTPPLPWKPVQWSSFRMDPAFAHHNPWRSVLPNSFKRAIKNCLFYVGLSDRYYD